LWDFISSPTNWKLITPGYMGFDFVSKDLPDKIYEGIIISYKVLPLLGIKQLGLQKSPILMTNIILWMNKELGLIKPGLTNTFGIHFERDLGEGNCELQTSIRNLRKNRKSTSYQE
jgi:hypothetical protein